MMEEAAKKYARTSKYKSDYPHCEKSGYDGFIAGANWQKEQNCDEDATDGFHSFKELYDFRRVYNAMFFNSSGNGLCNIHKSYRHSDGELCFGGGWFIVMAYTSNGDQISNHYENKYWNDFNCEERVKADKWDGHSSLDVLVRLNKHKLI